MTQRALRWNNRYLWMGLLALFGLLGLLILGAPATNQLESGSTWSRSPAGYSAWFETVADQGVRITRWQRPIPQLLDLLGDDGEVEGTTTLIQNTQDPVSTLLVVLPSTVDQAQINGLLPWMTDWVSAGHRLVVLGEKMPATAAPFSQTLNSDFGAIQIDTRRRRPGNVPQERQVLADDYGTVVWQEQWSSPSNTTPNNTGEIFFATTPHLAANAYLNQPGNFALLTNLVTREGGQVWVDEYLHGYRDRTETMTELSSDNLLSYLARTPLFVFTLQALAVVLIALLAFNRRLGRRVALQDPSVDNSQAYIEALAAVLHKANSHDFIFQTIHQAERARLQKSLGLGGMVITDEQLTEAWMQQTGGTAADLAPLLKSRPPRQDDQIKAWLKQLQSVHQFTQRRTSGHE